MEACETEASARIRRSRRRRVGRNLNEKFLRVTSRLSSMAFSRKQPDRLPDRPTDPATSGDGPGVLLDRRAAEVARVVRQPGCWSLAGTTEYPPLASRSGDAGLSAEVRCGGGSPAVGGARAEADASVQVVRYPRP